jgi:hypothetical protein
MAVIAHPGRYDMGRTLIERLILDFKDAGGQGIEVASGSHSLDDMHKFALIAQRYGLLSSAGSDFPRTGRRWPRCWPYRRFTTHLPAGVAGTARTHHPRSARGINQHKSTHMAQFFMIHPDNPQQRLIREAANILRNGGVVVYPTDSCYALGCMLGDKEGDGAHSGHPPDRAQTPPDAGVP